MTFVTAETEICTLAELAQARGLVLLTRINPRTGQQQTIMGARPVGEWKRLHVHTKQQPAA